MRRTLAGLLTLAVLALALSTWTATRTLVCIGDSNTAALPSWCDMLKDLLPGSGWRIVNRAHGFAVVSTPDELPNGRSQLAEALAKDRPAAVIMAFGTNDLLAAFQLRTNPNAPSQSELVDLVVERYAELRETAHAAGTRTFIALTPPLAVGGRRERLNDLVGMLNERLRHRFPAEELIDFHSPMNVETDYRDQLHVNADGQLKRAVAACRGLMSAFDPPRAIVCDTEVARLAEKVARGEITPLPRASRRRLKRAWKPVVRSLTDRRSAND